MNWLYIAVMGYIVFSALRGFHKGFFRVAYSLAAWLITIVFIGLAVPAARDMIVEHTTIAVQIEKTSEKYIRKQINQMIEDGTLAQNAGLPWLSLPESVLKKTGSGTNRIRAEKQGRIVEMCITGYGIMDNSIHSIWKS